MAVIMSKKIVVPRNVPVGATWLYEYGDDGVFEVPKTGIYSVEIHGGGGGGAAGSLDYIASGGGSGELYEVTLTEGDQIDVTVGAGGTAGTTLIRNTSTGNYYLGGNGGTSTFGDLSCAGGGGGRAGSSGTSQYTYGGSKSGSLASEGSYYYSAGHSQGDTYSLSGGEGNTNNPSQTYGDGGRAYMNYPNETPYAGEPGAVIITFLGVA